MSEDLSSEIISLGIKNMLRENEKDLEGALKLISLLSNPTRLKMAFLLSKEELCINDLNHILGVEQTLISHYMRAFKDLNLTRERRDGRKRYYTIEDNRMQDFLSAIRIMAR
ncbi:MAG: ArsR/SmtB family transcription factor [Candidatus Hydrothermarchaeales archaeon]